MKNKKNQLKKGIMLVILCLMICLCFLKGVISVVPFGANYTEVKSERAQADAPQSIPAQAGNVTELNIFGYSITQSWQGYFGNISGSIMLADANDKVMYNWSVVSPEGEVYATRNSSVTWANIACFDLATNHLALETQFDIITDDVDGINETFATGNGHDMFYTNNVQFTEGLCPSTKVYDNTGKGVDNYFEEVLLTDASYATQVIFTSILDEEGPLGFDAASHDFEMLVLENGHGTDTLVTPYYFYVELQ